MLPPSVGRSEAPSGFRVSGGVTSEPGAPGGMPEDELTYRMMLQEAILWVSKQILEEHREEITKRAEVRVRTLQELRG